MAELTVTAGDVVRLNFEVAGFERVSVGVSRAAQSIRDFRRFWKYVVAPWFFWRVVSNFQSEGVAAVGRWAPLSPRYAAWKTKHYPGKTILRRSDRLIRSLTLTGGVVIGGETVGGRLGPGGILRVTETSAEFGTSVSYARHHQWGAPRAHLPQRRILYLPPDSSRSLGRMLHRWTREELASTVFVSEQKRAIGGGLI